MTTTMTRIGAALRLSTALAGLWFLAQSVIYEVKEICGAPPMVYVFTLMFVSVFADTIVLGVAAKFYGAKVDHMVANTVDVKADGKAQPNRPKKDQ
jgi:hypothetical protein